MPRCEEEGTNHFGLLDYCFDCLVAMLKRRNTIIEEHNA